MKKNKMYVKKEKKKSARVGSALGPLCLEWAGDATAPPDAPPSDLMLQTLITRKKKI